MDSKGQITVFIILGILLLGIFALFLYFTGSVVEEAAESASEPITEDVSSEFIALQSYTESCLESTATEALILLGQQGGYLYPSTVGEFSATDPTNSDGISLDPIFIPYWHYNSQTNGESTVTISSLQPSLDDEDDYMSITAQLGRYVDEEIEDCLNGYAAFIEQEYSVEYETKETSVRIFDDELDFTLSMPLTTSRGDATAEMTTFYTDIDLDLKGYYEIAAELTESEQEYSFLENQLLELIHIHSRLDSSALPPITAMLISTQPEYLSWSTSEITTTIQSLLNSYISLLRYAGNENFYRYEFESELLSDLYQQIYDNSIVPLASNENAEMVSFAYLDWTPYVNINGGEEEIESNGFFTTSPFTQLPFTIGYQQYYNSYDVSYPVLVTIEDEDAFDGEGYTLNFAMETNLINNAAPDEEYEQSTTVASSTATSLLCDEEQKNSELVTTIVIDAFTGETLSDVFIGLSVPGFDYCAMGSTDESGELETAYPLLYGGELELSIDGYADTNYLFDTYLFADAAGIYGYAVEGIDYEVLEIYPLKEVEIQIEVLTAKKCVVPKKCNEDKDKCEEDQERICFDGGEDGDAILLGNPEISVESNGSITGMNEFYFTGAPSPADERMQVSIILERIPSEDDMAETSVSGFITFEYGEEAPTVELIPGQYAVEAFLTMEDDINILEDERCYYNEEGDGECDDIAGFITSSYLAGGYSLDDEDLYIEITEEDLYLSDILTLYVPIIDLNSYPSTTEALDDNENDIVDMNVLVSEDFLVANNLWEYFDDKNSIRSQLEPEWSSSIEE